MVFRLEVLILIVVVVVYLAGVLGLLERVILGMAWNMAPYIVTLRRFRSTVWSCL